MKKFLITLSLLLYAIIGYTQDIVYNDDGSVTFNSTSLQTITYDNVDFNYVELLKNPNQEANGIIGDIYQGGGIIFEVLGGINRDSLIYRKTLVLSSTSFGGNTETVMWHGAQIQSDNIKLLAADLDFTISSPSQCSALREKSLFKAAMVSANGDYSFENPYFDCLKDNNYKQIQKVKIKITAKRGKVKRVKFPGQVQELVLASANPNKQFSVGIYINGELKATVTPNTTPVINAKVGDDIKFTFINSFPSFKRVPVFSGIPATWIAHFAGETKYYCTPSIQPNERRPWLGFDSQVHGSLLRRYPVGYHDRFPDFQKDSQGNIVSWSFTLQREMDPNKTAYTPSYKWPKEKTVPVKQRNNQKEGLNMELLKAYKDPYFRYYQGETHILGSDPDEIFYLAGQNYDTFEEPPLQGLLRKTDEVWKKVGYAEAEDPINDMVTAYLKNRNVREGVYDFSCEKYESYEIQDNGTSPTNPDGTGSGNNKAPGLCKITLGNITVQFKLNVTSCLNNQNGFYANIVGSRWPGWDETLPYNFWGFKTKSKEELRKYFMVCTSENSIGNVRKQIIYFKNFADSKLTTIAQNGNVEQDFTMGGNGYNNLTLYKYNGDNSDSTIIGGKELLTIVLRFITVPNGNPGMQLAEISDGSYIYLEEFRDYKQGDPLYIPRYGRYVKKFTREYVIPKDSTLTFYTLDSDPFTFYNTGTEWYLSSRYQAKRLPWTGSESQETNVKYYLDPLNADGSVKQITTTPVGSGSKLTYTYHTPGDYQLRVKYRNSQLEAYHRIKVVDYWSQEKGRVAIRELTQRERTLLGFSAPDYYMAEVKDILCSYKFVDGYRCQSPANRFGRYNDYHDAYKWRASAGPSFYDRFYNPPEIRKIIEDYSDKTWFPFNWVRHFSDKPYPNTIDPSLFRKKEDVKDYLEDLFTDKVPEPWQLRLSWAPVSSVEKERFRTNIKVVYRMHKFFDNQTGAFSGNPKAISSTEVYNDFISDNEEDLKELINDLKFGRKIIIPKNVGYDAVYVENLDSAETSSIYIGECPFPSFRSAKEKSSAISDNYAGEFKVYPNPCNEKVQIQLPIISSQDIECKIYDVSGKLVFADEFAADNNRLIEIDTTKYNEGMYIIQLQNADGVLNHKKKIVINHKITIL